ncbi:hypothetical protein BH11ACT8_BH11ACT8_10330 [soil metagenome]
MRRRHHAQDERGSVAVVTALLLSAVLMTVGAMVIDLGMQRVARTDMQSLSDMVALDLSRLIDGSTVAVIEARPSWSTELAASVARNPSTIGDPPHVSAVLGTMSAATGAFEKSTLPNAVPTAVKVTASTAVAFGFGLADKGGASRSAVAAASSFACYKVGSWAATVSTGNSVLLNPVLQQLAGQSGAFSNGGTVRALDYSGLASATVDLNQLAANLGLGSVDELARSTVSLRQLYTGLKLLAVPSNTTTANVLGALALTVQSTASIAMGPLLAADSGASSLLGATANVLDLVGGSVSLLNGTNVANVYLGATLPSLSSAGLAVKLTQGPHQYCGRPGTAGTAGVPADTEQLNVHLGGQLAPTTTSFVPALIPGLLSSVASATLIAENYATFDLSVAGTSSRLTSIVCGSPQGVTLTAENGLARLTFATPLRAEVHAKLAGLSLLGLPTLVDSVIRLNASVTVTATIGASGVHNVTISVPPQDFDTPYPTTSGGLNITAITPGYANVQANVELVGGLLGASIALTTAQQNQLISTILSSGLTNLFSDSGPHSLTATVFNPLLGLIGARVGGSDVILDSVPALSCAHPRLVG